MAQEEEAERVEAEEIETSPPPSPPSSPPPPAPPSSSPPAPVAPGAKVKGVVNWFNVAKGFGECTFSTSLPPVPPFDWMLAPTSSMFPVKIQGQTPVKDGGQGGAPKWTTFPAR